MKVKFGDWLLLPSCMVVSIISSSTLSLHLFLSLLLKDPMVSLLLLLCGSSVLLVEIYSQQIWLLQIVILSIKYNINTTLKNHLQANNNRSDDIYTYYNFNLTLKDDLQSIYEQTKHFEYLLFTKSSLLNLE